MSYLRLPSRQHVSSPRAPRPTRSLVHEARKSVAHRRNPQAAHDDAITALARRCAELTEERNRYFRHYHRSPIPQCSLNHWGAIVDANTAARAIIGSHFNGVFSLGTFQDLLPAGDRRRFVEQLRSCLKGKHDVDVEVSLFSRSSAPVPVLMRLSYRARSPGEAEGVDVSWMDLTRQKRRLDSLTFRKETLDLLTQSPDPSTAVARCAYQVTRSLVDFCCIHLPHPPAHVAPIHVAFRDEGHEHLRQETGQRFLHQPLERMVDAILRAPATRTLRGQSQTPPILISQNCTIPLPSLHMLMGVPIQGGGAENLGVLIVGSFSRQSKEVHSQLQQDVETVARMLAQTLVTLRERQYERDATSRRDSLMAAMAHDAGSLLGAINFATAVFLKQHPEETINGSERTAKLIQRCALDVSAMMQDLLNAIRTDTQGLTLYLERQELGPALRRAVEIHAPHAREKSRALKVHIPDGAEELQVDIDGRMMSRVITNLVSNALRFGREGSSVEVSVHPQKDKVLIAVTDEGPGIPEDHLPYVFDRFWQAERRGSVGSGLGLSIVKSIVEAHGGEVGVTSTVGRGSVFFFTLPLSNDGTYSARDVTSPRSEAHAATSSLRSAAAIKSGN